MRTAGRLGLVRYDTTRCMHRPIDLSLQLAWNLSMMLMM